MPIPKSEGSSPLYSNAKRGKYDWIDWDLGCRFAFSTPKLIDKFNRQQKDHCGEIRRQIRMFEKLGFWLEELDIEGFDTDCPIVVVGDTMQSRDEARY